MPDEAILQKEKDEQLKNEQNCPAMEIHEKIVRMMSKRESEKSINTPIFNA